MVESPTSADLILGYIHLLKDEGVYYVKYRQARYSALHLIKPCLKKPLWIMQSKVVRTDFFISLRVQNTPGYKATLPVLASVCTIHSSATFTRKVGNLARLS